MNEMDTRFANQYNIQWFPGHMTKTLRMMEQEIQHVDASLVLLDARIPLSSLNPEIERITAGKPHLYVLNKSDLADPEITKQWLAYFKSAGAGCIAMDSKQRGRAYEGPDRKGAFRADGAPPQPRHGRRSHPRYDRGHPERRQVHLHQLVCGHDPRQGCQQARRDPR
jgi:hypothetical protein